MFHLGTIDSVAPRELMQLQIWVVLLRFGTLTCLSSYLFYYWKSISLVAIFMLTGRKQGGLWEVQQTNCDGSTLSYYIIHFRAARWQSHNNLHSAIAVTDSEFLFQQLHSTPFFSDGRSWESQFGDFFFELVFVSSHLSCGHWRVSLWEVTSLAEIPAILGLFCRLKMKSLNLAIVLVCVAVQLLCVWV